MSLRCLLCRLAGQECEQSALKAVTEEKKPRRKLKKQPRLNIPGAVRLDAERPILQQLNRWR